MSNGSRFNPFSVSDEDRRYVEQIMLDVRKRGDEALIDYTSRPKPFDNVRLSRDMLKVSEDEIKQSVNQVSSEVKRSIYLMMRNLRKMVKLQARKFSSISFKDESIRYFLKSFPLERIGILVPGGKAALVSTLVMAAYPAALLGVKEICVLTPPRPDGSVNPVILYAASLMGLKKIFRCNTVAGVGALTFGTETIPRVDKILGAGNRFVMMAKMIASSYGVSIDLPAGPSELVILADGDADPGLIALDLAAQAEHSPDTFIVLLTTSEALARSVGKILETVCEKYGLKNKIDVRIVSSIKEGVEKCNMMAPEHVSLHVKNPERIAGEIVSAGTVLIGSLSAPAIGDYASGSNHILPTGGYAKVRGGITVLDYLRFVSYQSFSKSFLKYVTPHIKALSSIEGLPFHGLSVEARIKRKQVL
ncbi:MAG: histidinol dehydrogenase [Thermoproteota archaeon]